LRLNLTRQGYRLLLDTIYIAKWVIEAHRVGENPHMEPYERLAQKVYAQVASSELKR
jgi:hypothetical protein